MKSVTTIEEARTLRYGYGTTYKDGRCAYGVPCYSNKKVVYQCNHGPGYGPGELYCSQHAKKIARDKEKSDGTVVLRERLPLQAKVAHGN